MISTSPFGPTILQPGVPTKSPDSLITIGKPMLRASVADNSTWSALRTGPKIDTPASSFFGPTIVTLSSQAYCPGCDKSLFFVNWYPSPNNTSTVSFVRKIKYLKKVS